MKVTALRLLAALALVVGAWACHNDRAPSSPTPTGGSVTGVVRGDRPCIRSACFGPMPVLGGARVKAVGSDGQEVAVTADTQGVYSLSLPAGAFTLTGSSAGFQDASASGVAASGHSMTMPDVTLKTAPWAVSGLATDSRGNPVPGVAVTLGLGDAYFSTLKEATDSSGRYRIASTTAHFNEVTIAAVADGFDYLLPQRLPCCSSPADTVLDIHLVRILRVEVDGPGRLQVGEAVELPANTILLDNNTQRQVYVKPSCSAPSVVGVESGTRGWVIRGLQPGRATLTFDYRGVAGYWDVQVGGTLELARQGHRIIPRESLCLVH